MCVKDKLKSDCFTDRRFIWCLKNVIRFKYIYTCMCMSNVKYCRDKRNATELFVVRWMDLESVIQSEVSQKEKTNTVC